MLKAGIFSLGICSGLYLGIYIREQGYAKNLTRSYYHYKNENPNNKPKLQKAQ